MTASLELGMNRLETAEGGESKSSSSLPRRVSFSDIQEIHRIENKASLSRKEKVNRWMTAYEHDRIRCECDRAMFHLAKSESPAMKNDLRGLELFDPETISRSRSKHRMAVTAVVRTQLEQKRCGLSNPEDIRRVYKQFVRDSIDDARANASIDHEEVKDYMATTMTELETQECLKQKNRSKSLQRRLLGSLNKRLSRKSGNNQ